MFKGIKTGASAEYTEEEKKAAIEDQKEFVKNDITQRKMVLPARVFEGFEELRYELRGVFRGMIEGILEHYDSEERDLAIVFPSHLDCHCR